MRVRLHSRVSWVPVMAVLHHLSEHVSEQTRNRKSRKLLQPSAFFTVSWCQSNCTADTSRSSRQQDRTVAREPVQLNAVRFSRSCCFLILQVWVYTRPSGHVCIGSCFWVLCRSNTQSKCWQDNSQLHIAVMAKEPAISLLTALLTCMSDD